MKLSFVDLNVVTKKVVFAFFKCFFLKNRNTLSRRGDGSGTVTNRRRAGTQCVVGTVDGFCETFGEPPSFALYIPVRRCLFLFQGRIKIRQFVCACVCVCFFVTVWLLEPRGLCKWEQWCQLIKCLCAGLCSTPMLSCSRPRWLFETDLYVHYSCV